MKIKRPTSNQPIPKNAKRVFKGVLFDVWQWKQKMFDGSVEVFEKLKRPDIVNVLPVVDGKIILTIQSQPGTKSFIGAAGGRIDKGETPLSAAKRELLEETGYKAKKFILWYSIQLHPKIDCAIYTFIAKSCKKVQKLRPDSGEKIKLKGFSFDDFLKVTAQKNYRDTEISLRLFQIIQNPKKLKEMKKLFLD